MNNIPTELKYEILRYANGDNLFLVSKFWNDEMKLYKKAVSKISNWYFGYKLNIYSYDTRGEFIRDLVLNHKNLLTYPEFCVFCGFNKSLISVLPALPKRKRSHVLEWVRNLPENIHLCAIF